MHDRVQGKIEKCQFKKSTNKNTNHHASASLTCGRAADMFLPGLVGDIVEKEVMPTSRIMTVVHHETGFPLTHKRPFDPPDCNSVSLPLTEMEMAIHRENMSKLAAMSGQEMAQAIDEIYEKLDISYIHKLRERAESKYAKLATREKKATISLDQSNIISSEGPTGINNEPSIPLENSELEKLAWTEPAINMMKTDSVFPLTPESRNYHKVRFDLKGRIIIGNVPTYAGLHHHGEDATEPGYSISELVYLAKSTFPSQRILALNTISAILMNIRHDLIQDIDLINSISSVLQDMKFSVIVRTALEEPNQTIIVAALECLGSMFGMIEEEKVWDILFLSRLGYRNFSLAWKEIENFNVSINGCRSVKDIGQIVDILLRMNLFERCRDLIADKIPYTLFPILFILIRTARYSSDASSCICSTPRLLELIRDQVLQISYPSSSPTNYKLQTWAIKFYRIISQASKETARVVIRLGIIPIILRFITLEDQREGSMVFYNLHTEVFNIIGVFWKFGLAGFVFDEYREFIHDHFVSVLNSMVEDVSRHGIRRGVSLLRMMHPLSTVFSQHLSIGNPDDAMLEYVQRSIISIQSLQTAIQKSDSNIDKRLSLHLRMLRSAISDFVTAYLEKLPNTFGFIKFARLWDDIINKPEAWWDQFDIEKAFQAANSHVVKADIRCRQVPWNLGLLSLSDVWTAHELIKSTIYYNDASSMLDLSHTLSKLYPEIIHITIPTAVRVKASYKTVDYMGIFSQGIVQASHSALKTGLDESIYNAVQLITCALPGDEYLVSTALNMLSRHIPDTMTRLYQTQLLEDAKICESQSLYGYISAGLASLCFSSNSTLPTPSSWIFQPLNIINQNDITDNNLFNLIISVINVVQQSYSILDPYGTMKSTLEMFMIEDSQHHLVTIDSQVYQSMSEFIDHIFTPQNINILASEPSFYTFYQSLLRQYGSNGFPDALFTKCITIPLAMQFPSSYRASFWTELFVLINRIFIDTSSNSIIGSIDLYITPTETDISLLSLYLRCMVEKGLKEEDSPFLFRIASHHVSAFLNSNADAKGLDGADLARLKHDWGELLSTNNELSKSTKF